MQELDKSGASQQRFDSTEAYPRQLHEVDKATYLELKQHLVSSTAR